MPGSSRLVDRYGRRVTTLRISLTDRCNFRCVYCMPPEGAPLLEQSRHLTIDQLERVVRLSGCLGVRRYRLTGGEPLLRPGIVEIVRRLRAVDTVGELSMTTNASLLEKFAPALRGAGLDRLNISLDSLAPDRFTEVTRFRLYERVRNGIDSAIDEGFPVKINVVAMAGMRDREIIEFVELAVRRSLEVRFLEFMPLCGTGWGAERVLPIERVRNTVRKRFTLAELPRIDEPSQTFSVSGSAARVGFIAPLSEPFCATCSRIRITSDGRIRPCLFSETEFDLGNLIRRGASDEEVMEALARAVWNKPAGSQFNDRPFQENETTDGRITQGPLIRGIGG